jgi:hypothetical protein
VEGEIDCDDLVLLTGSTVIGYFGRGFFLLSKSNQTNGRSIRSFRLPVSEVPRYLKI